MLRRTFGAAAALTVSASLSLFSLPLIASTATAASVDDTARISRTVIETPPAEGPGPAIETTIDDPLGAPTLPVITEASPMKTIDLEALYVTFLEEKARADAAAAAEALHTKTLAYDPALIAAIGNQLAGGHTICCPGYACAYGDAIIAGIANDHSVYGCGTCVWTNWGGGNSSFRSLGSNEALLREAYDQIASGKPTVIHVTGPYGEHWITLMGYHDVEDPDNLTLANFTALDPADGTEMDPASKYVLYGDYCEHISSR